MLTAATPQLLRADASFISGIDALETDAMVFGYLGFSPRFNEYPYLP